MYSPTKSNEERTVYPSNPEACTVARELYRIAQSIGAISHSPDEYREMAARIVELGKQLHDVADNGK